MAAETVRESVAAQTTCLLFVYGSLKRGEINHHELRGARFIGTVRTAPAFALREIAGYPALVPGTRAIVGELYELLTASLALLDDFEGEDYVRGQIDLGDRVSVISYVARDPEAGQELALSEWPDPPDTG